MSDCSCTQRVLVVATLFGCYMAGAIYVGCTVFWQNGLDFSVRAAAAGNTGVEGLPKSKSAQKVDAGEENYPAAAPARIQTRDLSITCQSLYQ